MLIAVLTIKIILPFYENFINKDLEFNLFSNYYIIPGLLLFTIIIGIISGSYSAFFLSSFTPTKTLKGSGKLDLKSNKLRNALVIFQFSSSIFLISGTLIINDQINYMITKDVGFDKESLLVIENANVIGEQFDAFKDQLSGYPEVLNVSSSASYPGNAFVGGVQSLKDASMGNAVSMYMNIADHDFVKTLNMNIVEGRDFKREFITDTLSVILNEMAVNILGISNPMDQAITNGGGVYFDIIGIVKDFNFQSLHSEIQPLYMILLRGPGGITYISIRLSKGDLNKKVNLIKSQW